MKKGKSMKVPVDYAPPMDHMSATQRTDDLDARIDRDVAAVKALAASGMSVEDASRKVVFDRLGAAASAGPAAKAVVDLHAPLGPHGELPLVRPRQVDERGYNTYVKVPSVVLRLDGRYGVARPRVGGVGTAQEETTYATRAEAERRAWALARELGNTRDWP